MDDQHNFNLIRQGGKMRDKGVDALFRKYAVQFHNHFTFRGRLSDADADDIVQESFIKIILNSESYRGESPLAAWLWSIAHHCLLDYFRRAKSRSTTVADKKADKINKGAIAFEHTAVMEAAESRVQGGVKVTALPYAGESEAKSHRTSSPHMFISTDNDEDGDENDGLAALEGQFNSLWKYDPDPKTGFFENCIDKGYAEFARRFNVGAYALSLSFDGYDTEYIAKAIERTEGATRTLLTESRKRIKQFLLPCQEYR